MSSPITPTELVDAVVTILQTSPTAGRVVADPIYQSDPLRYPEMLKDPTTGDIDGFFVRTSREEPEKRRGVDGAEQYVWLSVYGMLRPAADETGCTSRPLFGQKVQDAKNALRASPDLGLAVNGREVRHEGLHAPSGYEAWPFEERELHVAPMMVRIFVAFC